jgi:uncharacterized metal-binding protein YceD (DUF177 family)
MSEDFAHRLTLDSIGAGTHPNLIADETERAEIAERLGLPSIERLEAHATLDREGERIRARGRIQASLNQNCVVTGEPVAAMIDEPFDILFLPEPTGRPDEEVELGEEECDVVFHDGATIDLGAAIADTLALALDPYPRSAGAEAALKEAGILTQEQASPFAALAKLKGSDN